MTNARNKKLLEDRYAAHPLLSELKSALAAAEQFASKAAAVNADPHLSVSGRADRASRLVKSALRDLRDLSQHVDAKRSVLAEVIAKIKTKSFEPTNVASALLRSEMRAAVKAMSLSDRSSVLLGEKADSAFVDSVLESSPILSGLDAHFYEEVHEQHMYKLFSAESFEAEKLTNEIAEADAIFQLARQDVAAASGLLEHEFAALERQVSERKDAVWLKRERDMNGAEVVIVLEPKSAKTRLAGADDLRDGKFYANYTEYQADRAA
jgi:hypothetical protein